jgi:xanthine dehydrogenase large subunit
VERQGQADDQRPGQLQDPRGGRHAAGPARNLVENRKNPEDTVFHSKAVGEPPFMLGIAAWCALKDAVASLADYRVQPAIDAPATPERVLWGCEQMRKSLSGDQHE